MGVAYYDGELYFEPIAVKKQVEILPLIII